MYDEKVTHFGQQIVRAWKFMDNLLGLACIVIFSEMLYDMLALFYFHLTHAFCLLFSYYSLCIYLS